MIEKSKSILLPIFLTVSYLIFSYFFMSNLYSKGLMVSIKDLSEINVGTKFLCDFMNSLLIVLVILSIVIYQKKPFSEVGVTLRSPMIISVLSAIYIVMFLLNSDFTIKGLYAAFFYLVIVAFSEEFIFRGYLFTAIDSQFNFWIAAIISGMLWGVPHAFLPSIINSYDTVGFVISVLSQLGGGILMGAVFAILYKKSKTLFVPVLIHAILDYSGVLFRAV